jgi:hypothetical protein
MVKKRRIECKNKGAKDELVKNTKNNTNHNSKNESRRTRSGKGHHSHLINSDSTSVVDLTHEITIGGRGET